MFNTLLRLDKHKNKEIFLNIIDFFKSILQHRSLGLNMYNIKYSPEKNCHKINKVKGYGKVG